MKWSWVNLRTDINILLQYKNITISVSLLTALRIWVSLPDELGSEAPPQSDLRGRRSSQVSPCNCSNQRRGGGGGGLVNTTHYQEETELEDSENYLLLPGALESQQSQMENLCPPSYTDCLTV